MKDIQTFSETVKDRESVSVLVGEGREKAVENTRITEGTRQQQVGLKHGNYLLSLTKTILSIYSTFDYKIVIHN